MVILGGGFGGLYAAKALAKSDFSVTLVDKRNFHLFQPLLYQVATGGLSPGDIASPLRAIFRRKNNVAVLLAHARDIDPEKRLVLLRDGEVEFDTLIISTGVTHHYFGHPEWGDIAPGLKTVEDALDIRRRVLGAFEEAELEHDPVKRKAWLRFVIVGGGPTGVELAGALGELSNHTLAGEYRSFQSEDAEIILLEGGPRILSSYAPELSERAIKALNSLGVTVRTNTLSTGLQDGRLLLKHGGNVETMDAKTVLWAAGVKATEMGHVLAERLGAKLDDVGRVVVSPQLTISGHENIFVIGDLAAFQQDGHPLPGVAPVAMQQAAYVARVLRARKANRVFTHAFRYRDKGSLAVIGRNRAVAQFRKFKVSGFPAWAVWALVHIAYLIGFKNKLLVIIQWAWSYITLNRGALLIQGGEEPEHG